MARRGLANGIHYTEFFHERQKGANHLTQSSGRHRCLYNQPNSACILKFSRTCLYLRDGVNGGSTRDVCKGCFYFRMTCLANHIHGIAFTRQTFCGRMRFLYKRTGCIHNLRAISARQVLFFRSNPVSAQQKRRSRSIFCTVHNLNSSPIKGFDNLWVVDQRTQGFYRSGSFLKRRFDHFKSSLNAITSACFICNSNGGHN